MSETKEETREAEGRNILTDIFVKSIGLVPHGANNLDWVLLKNREEGGINMPDETVTTEEGQEEVNAPDESLLEKLKNLFVPRAELDDLLKAEQPQPEPEPEVVQKSAPGIDPAILERFEIIEKRHQDQLAELTKAHADTQAELEKARRTAEDERERRVKREWLEKAREYQVLPVSVTELGDHLNTFAKALPAEEMTWLGELLKATDAQLFDAGLYYERGTSQAMEQLPAIQKVQKEAAETGDIRAALLNLPAAEQNELLKSLRGGDR